MSNEPARQVKEDDSLKQYLIEEFIEDYQEGRLSRRDALKRLVGLTASVAVSNALLAACAPVAAPAATAVPATSAPIPTTAPTLAPPATNVPATTAPVATAGATAAATAMPDATLTTQATATVAPGDASLNVAPDDPAIQASDVTFPNGDATIMAYLARPAANGTYPAILVCHENRGLTDHIRDVTRRLAKAGYVGLAVDLLSRQGGTAKVDAAQISSALGNSPPSQFVSDFQAGLNYLKTQPFVAAGQFGMVGFCFGGGVTWRCATQIPELKAAVPYYGPNPPLEDVPKIQAAVLAMYGELDQRIDAGIPAIEQAMKQNNKVFEYVIFPGANHAFNNDTGGNYNPTAAREAWAKALDWFAKYVKA